LCSEVVGLQRLLFNNCWNAALLNNGWNAARQRLMRLLSPFLLQNLLQQQLLLLSQPLPLLVLLRLLLLMLPWRRWALHFESPASDLPATWCW